MGNEKESRVKELIDEHVVKVGECLDCFNTCFEAFLGGDMARAEITHVDCDYAETEADIIRRKIADHLYSGAFLPLARKDVFKLAEFVDKIADEAEAASDVMVYQRPDIPGEYKAMLREIVEKTAGMFVTFRQAVELFTPSETLPTDDNFTAILEKLTAVGMVESEIDKKEESLMRTIFESGLSLANKIQLERFLRRVTKISDVIEDAADNVHLLVIRERI